MKLFSKLYRKVIAWSEHRHAPYYLAGVSFAESSMFPIPPDIMLISMALAKPERSWRFAWVATISSVVGGMFGYLIGAFFMHLIYPFIVKFGYLHGFNTVQHWFELWGFWIIIVAGFSPIPYKLFTIGAGAIHMAFLPFVFASLVGRSMRFFAVAAAMYFGGAKLNQFIQRYVDVVGWLMVLVLLLAIILYIYW